MTNRERAVHIFNSMTSDLCGDIERALDEAEKRGAEKMRERAAKEMDEVLDLRMDELVAAKRQIRALPIDSND